VVNEVFIKTRSHSKMPANIKKERLPSSGQLRHRRDRKLDSMDEIADEYLEDGESYSRNED
jgi:hypothetical protein